jgi:hypothetical protein
LRATLRPGTLIRDIVPEWPSPETHAKRVCDWKCMTSIIFDHIPFSLIFGSPKSLFPAGISLSSRGEVCDELSKLVTYGRAWMRGTMRQAVLGSHVGSLICPISGFLGPWKASIAINGCGSTSKITTNCHKGRMALIRYTGRIPGHTYPIEFPFICAPTNLHSYPSSVMRLLCFQIERCA